MPPIYNASSILDVILVIKVHQILTVVESLPVVATTPLIPQRLNVKRNIFAPTLENVLKRITIFVLEMRQIHNI